MPWATFTAHRHQPNWTDVTPTALADFLLVLLRKIADAPVDNGTVDHALHEAFADLASQFQRPPVNFRSAVGHQNAPHAAAMMPKPMRVFSPRPACQASSRSASEPESTNGATMPTTTPDPASAFTFENTACEERSER